MMCMLTLKVQKGFEFLTLISLTLLSSLVCSFPSQGHRAGAVGSMCEQGKKTDPLLSVCELPDLTIVLHPCCLFISSVLTEADVLDSESLNLFCHF